MNANHHYYILSSPPALKFTKQENTGSTIDGAEFLHWWSLILENPQIEHMGDQNSRAFPLLHDHAKCEAFLSLFISFPSIDSLQVGWQLLSLFALLFKLTDSFSLYFHSSLLFLLPIRFTHLNSSETRRNPKNRMKDFYLSLRITRF